MNNHTGMVCRCQYLPDPAARETTLLAPDSIDRRLVVRYGAWLLTGGYTALPTYAWVYYARLGVTEAEMVCIAQLCTYWWTERAPYPGEAALAARMGKSVRTIQGYLRSLEGKGLLHIQTQFSPHGRQSTNAYDLRPFFTAVEGLARLDGLLPTDDAASATPTTPTDDAASATPTTPTDDAASATPTTPDDDAASATPTTPADDAASATPTTPDDDACTSGPCDHTNATWGDAERKPLCAGTTRVGTDNRPKDASTPTRGEGEGSRARGVKNPSPQVNPIEIDNFDFDSIPPHPPFTHLAEGEPPQATQGRPQGAERNGAGRPSSERPRPHPALAPHISPGPLGPPLCGDDLPPLDPPHQALAAALAALGNELGDDAPRSSLGRARNLRRDAGVSLDRFLHLLDEAAARTRDRQASIVKRRRDGQAPNGMPYLFAVLQDLVHPAPPRPAAVGPSTDRRQSGPLGRRRRRRAGDRGEVSDSYAAWSDSPAPLPITEEHPVWRAALAELAQVMTAENYNAWLATTRALDEEGDLLRVAVPAPFNRDWLACKLAGKVLAALHKIDYDALGAGRIARVEYVVEAAACAPCDAVAKAS